MKKANIIENYHCNVDIDQDPFIEDLLIITVKRYRYSHKFTITKNDKVSKLLDRIKETDTMPEMEE